LIRHSGLGSVRLAENQGGELKNVRILVLPAARRQTRLDARLVEEGHPVPVLLAGDLRQKHPLRVALPHQQSVPAHLDLLPVRYPAQRREHRDFVFQVTQFGGGDRPEARVANRRHGGDVAHRHAERFEGRDVADTPPQISVLLQRHEGAAVPRQSFEPPGRALIELALADDALHGIFRDRHQRLLFLRVELELGPFRTAWRRLLDERLRSVAYHPAFVGGDVSGIGVLEDYSAIGSQALGGDHRGHDTPAAASLPHPLLEVARHVEVVPLFDRFQRLVVDGLRLVVSMVMRHIGAGHDEGIKVAVGSPALLLDQLGQTHAQRPRGPVVLFAHHHRHQLEFAQHPLKEGQFVFQRVLPPALNLPVPLAGELDQRTHGHQLRGKSLVDRNQPQRRGVGVAIIDRVEGEGLIVAGRYHHHPSELPSSQQSIGVCRHRTGKRIPRMRRYQRHQGLLECRLGRLSQKAVHHLGKFFRVGGIEASGNSGLSYFLFVSRAGAMESQQHAG